MQNGQNHHKKRSPYLPRLCSSASIKDVHLRKSNHPSSSSSSSSSSFDDPNLSPRVSCMGQVTSENTSSYTSNYFKFISATGANKTATSHYVKKNHPRRKSTSSTSITRGPKCNFTSPEVNISQMDPPLPVVIRVKDPGFDREEVNLWKRRSDFALKNLELSNIDVPKTCYYERIVDDGGLLSRQREIRQSSNLVSK